MKFVACNFSEEKSVNLAVAADTDSDKALFGIEPVPYAALKAYRAAIAGVDMDPTVTIEGATVGQSFMGIPVHTYAEDVVIHVIPSDDLKWEVEIDGEVFKRLLAIGGNEEFIFVGDNSQDGVVEAFKEAAGRTDSIRANGLLVPRELKDEALAELDKLIAEIEA